MPASSQKIFSDTFPEGKVFFILIKISLNFVPNDSIDNIPALVQTIVGTEKGDKTLSEPMLTRFYDAYVGH